MDDNKECRVCKLSLPPKSYKPNTRTCAKCLRRKYTDKMRSNRGAEYLWTRAFKRAKANGREFTIKVSDVVIPEFCPYFGLKLEFATDLQAPNSPSLDRIDNSKGYVPGNVEVISVKANRLKSALSTEEMRAFATTLLNRLSALQ